MPSTKYKVVLLELWLGLLLAATRTVAGSANLGNATTLSFRSDTIALATSTGARVEIHLLSGNIFRLWIGTDGRLTDEGSKAARIVLPHTWEQMPARIDTVADGWFVSAGKFALKITSSPLMFALFRPDRTTLIWRDLKPIQLNESGSYQTLSSTADERIFGGGQQNGRFEFKGRIMEIAYSDGWEEGDRPNPAPFYMSSRGYGVLRNTWSDGRYDFWSDNYLTTTHKEKRFDAYYLVGKNINEVLDHYTQLTGWAGLLPRWAFEYGDADCYNDRDNSDKPGTAPP